MFKEGGKIITIEKVGLQNIRNTNENEDSNKIRMPYVNKFGLRKACTYCERMFCKESI